MYMAKYEVLCCFCSSLLIGVDSRIEELESKLARYEKEGNVIPTGLPASISRMLSSSRSLKPL
jgi:hypothetical protein